MRISNTLRRGPLTVVLSLMVLAFATPVAAKPTKAPKAAKAPAKAATPPAAPTPPASAPAATTPAASDPAAAAPTTTDAPPATTPAASTEAVPVDPETLAANLRLRRLEQQVQALKERAWRAKARTTQLKEGVLGGGIGTAATIVHVNKMGSSFRLAQLVYTLDGKEIYTRSATDDPNLYEKKTIDILTGPLNRGSHTLGVVALYRGHGYGLFQYMTKYKFTVRSNHTFLASEGNATRIEVVGYEKGGITTPLEKRPTVEFKVTVGSAEKQ